jgi:hypothetical protein
VAKNIYVICPVRNLKAGELAVLKGHVAEQERQGHNVHFPPRDVDQSDPIGWHIACAHRAAMRTADEVHILWNVESYGEHFDVGMAFILDKKLVFIQEPDATPQKSYTNVLRIVAGLDPQP